MDLRSGGNFLTRSSDTNDGADTPAFVARFKSRTHDMNVARAVKRVVEAAVGDFDEVVLDALALGELRRVDEVCRTHLLCPRLLAGIGVDGDDARRLDER